MCKESVLVADPILILCKKAAVCTSGADGVLGYKCESNASINRFPPLMRIAPHLARTRARAE